MPNPAEQALMQLLTRIFEDSVVSVPERTQLLEVRASTDLDHAAVQRVFAAFVERKWGEALADGQVTAQEKLVLQRVLEELELPDEAIPLQLRMALSR